MTGKETRCVSKAHNSTIYCAAVSHDGRYLATGSADKAIRIWDMATGECLKARAAWRLLFWRHCGNHESAHFLIRWVLFVLQSVEGLA